MSTPTVSQNTVSQTTVSQTTVSQTSVTDHSVTEHIVTEHSVTVHSNTDYSTRDHANRRHLDDITTKTYAHHSVTRRPQRRSDHRAFQTTVTQTTSLHIDYTVSQTTEPLRLQSLIASLTNCSFTLNRVSHLPQCHSQTKALITDDSILHRSLRHSQITMSLKSQRHKKKRKKKSLTPIDRGIILWRQS